MAVPGRGAGRGQPVRLAEEVRATRFGMLGALPTVRWHLDRLLPVSLSQLQAWPSGRTRALASAIGPGYDSGPKFSPTQAKSYSDCTDDKGSLHVGPYVSSIP